jgi:hypothetical protein
MEWLYPSFISTLLLKPITNVVSTTRWIAHTKYEIEEGSLTFYKLSLIINIDGTSHLSSGATTFILKYDNCKNEVTLPYYYRWEVDNEKENERKRTFHIWFSGDHRKKFIVYTKMPNAIDIFNKRLATRYDILKKNKK